MFGDSILAQRLVQAVYGTLAVLAIALLARQVAKDDRVALWAPNGWRWIVAALRLVLTSIGVVVVPTQLAIARANDAFEADGSLKDERQQASIEAIAADVVRFAGRLTADL